VAETGFWRAAFAVAGKDLRVETRTKTAFASAMVFAVLVLAVFYFMRDPTVVSLVDIAPGALWVTFTFAAMLGLNRAFLLERENRALDGILLSPVPRTAIFVGKLLGNLAFVAVVELVSLPLFVLFYDLPIGPQVPALLVVMAMATLAFVAVGTLLSAMVVRTRFAELMLPILLLPFLIPPVVGAVQLTARILAARPLSELFGWLKLLASFDVVFVILCILLFEATLDE
jgi:heme exporter protein B